MLNKIFSFGKNKPRNWHVLDFRSGALETIPLTPVAAEQALTEASPWMISRNQSGMHLSCNGSDPIPINVNGNPYEAQRIGVFDEGIEYIALVPTYEGPTMPLLIVGGDEPAWAQNGGPRFRLFQNNGPDSQGPYSFEELEQQVTALSGQLPFDSFARVDRGSAGYFYLKDLWPDCVRAEEAPPQPTDLSTQSVPRPEQAPLLMTEYTKASSSVSRRAAPTHVPPPDEGPQMCINCGRRFQPGAELYFPHHFSLRDQPPFKPSAANMSPSGKIVDEKGTECKRLACPHCIMELPAFFGIHPYDVFSLVGQSQSGKSYYLATMLSALARSLEGWGDNYCLSTDDAPHVSETLEKLKGIPMRSGPCYSRYISKTTELQATQQQIRLDDTDISVPKPFVLRLGSKQPHLEKRIVLYDNQGEHFTIVGHVGEKAIGAEVAVGHLAVASVLLVLYDPLRSQELVRQLPQKQKKAIACEECSESGGCPHAARIQNLLSEEGSQTADTTDDLQVNMLSNAYHRIVKSIGETEARAKQERPLALMVGKWDAWASLAPDINPEYFDAQERLNLTVVNRNSVILKDMLGKFNPGIVAAANRLSNNVVCFPVSALGCSPITCYDADRGAIIHPPSRPADPWCVAPPLLWGLSSIQKGFVPTVGG